MITEQCETCRLAETDACIFHGYEDVIVPEYCPYKVGIWTSRSMLEVQSARLVHRTVVWQE